MELRELYNEAKRGSTTAQEQLFDELSGQFRLQCERYVKNPADAEERMMDGFCKFFDSNQSFHFESDAALYSCLRQIMINECLMQLRRKNVFILLTDQTESIQEVGEDPLDRMSVNEIFKMILELPVGYRTVFNLFAVEGLSHKEIAILLGISRGTCKSQYAKARMLLQKMIISNEKTNGKQREQ